MQMTDELRFKLLQLLEKKPNLSQRKIASELSISLGKVNYCLNVLLEEGLLEAQKVIDSKNKASYLYKITPIGVQAKLNVGEVFLNQKVNEAETIKIEITELRAQLAMKE